MELTQEYSNNLEIPETYRGIDLDVQLRRALEKRVDDFDLKQFYVDWNTPARTRLLDTVRVHAGRKVHNLRGALKRRLAYTKAESSEAHKKYLQGYRFAKKNDPTYREKERLRMKDIRERKARGDIQARQRSSENLTRARAVRAARSTVTSSVTGSSVFCDMEGLQNVLNIQIDTALPNIEANQQPECEDNELMHGGDDYDLYDGISPTNYDSYQEDGMCVDPVAALDGYYEAEDLSETDMRQMRVIVEPEPEPESFHNLSDSELDYDTINAADVARGYAYNRGSDTGDLCSDDEPGSESDYEPSEDDDPNARRPKGRPKGSRNACNANLPFCKGHSRDEFNFIKKHPKRGCPYSVMQRVNEMTCEVVHCSSLDEVLLEMKLHQERFSSYDSLENSHGERRASQIESRELHKVVFHVPLPVKDVIGSDFEETPYHLDLYLGEFTDQLCSVYPYHVTHSHAVKNPKKKPYEYEFLCYYHSKTYSSRLAESEAILLRARLDTTPSARCEGVVRIKFNREDEILAISVRHKHHKCNSTRTTSAAEIRSYMEKFTSKNPIFAMSRVDFVNSALPNFEDDCKGRLRKAYDKCLESIFKLDDCEWTSMMKLAESQPHRYLTFVFNCIGMTGILFILKEVVELCGFADALSVDTTYGTNRKNSDLFMINACVDRSGVPFGFMFMYNTEKIYHDVMRNSCFVMGEGGPGNFNPTEKCPLPQCQTSLEIQEDVLSKQQFKTKTGGTTALLACALRLVGGTNKPGEQRIANGRVCPTIHEQSYAFGHPSTYVTPSINSDLSETSRQTADEKPLKHFIGVNVNLVLMDKDKGSIKAAHYTLPSAKPHICLWHVQKAIETHCKTSKSFANVGKSFRFRDEFPDLFSQFAPYFSPLAFDHGHDECQRAFGENAIKCVAHNRSYYEHRYKEVILKSVSVNYGGKTQTLAGHLKSIITKHARVHQTVPQGFPYLKLGDSFPHSERKYRTTDEISDLIVKEMISFCITQELYCTLLYLWKNWYQDDIIELWTTYRLPHYNNYTTNMVSEGNHSKLKTILDLRTGSRRLDRLFSGLDLKLYDHYRRRVSRADHAIRVKMYEDVLKCNKPNWLAERNKTMKKIAIDDDPDFKTVDQFRADCRKFATDVLNFQCSCFNYTRLNVHFCKHIMRGLTKSAFTNKYEREYRMNLRAREYPPFYCMYIDEHASYTEDPSNTSHIFTYCQPTESYLAWRRTEGDQILREKGSNMTYSIEWCPRPVTFDQVDGESSSEEEQEHEVVDTDNNGVRIELVNSVLSKMFKRSTPKSIETKITSLLRALYTEVDKSVEFVMREQNMMRPTSVRDRENMNGSTAAIYRNGTKNPESIKDSLRGLDEQLVRLLSKSVEKPDLSARFKRLDLE